MRLEDLILGMESLEIGHPAVAASLNPGSLARLECVQGTSESSLVEDRLYVLAIATLYEDPRAALDELIDLEQRITERTGGWQRAYEIEEELELARRVAGTPRDVQLIRISYGRAHGGASGRRILPAGELPGTSVPPSFENAVRLLEDGSG